MKPAPLLLLAVLLAGCAQQSAVIAPPEVVEFRQAGDSIYFRWESDSLQPFERLEYALEPLGAATEAAAKPAESGVLATPSGARMSQPLEPGRYKLRVRAIHRAGDGGMRSVDAAIPNAWVEIAPPTYRFVTREELDLEKPQNLRILYTIHPYWSERGAHEAAGDLTLPPKQCRLILTAVCRGVLSEAFRDVRDLRISDGSSRPWDNIERLRALVSEGRPSTSGENGEKGLPEFIDPHALLTIDYRARGAGSSLPAQLAVRLFDMSATAAKALGGTATPQVALGRTLIFEDYVELADASDAASLARSLVEGWKELLLEMRNSARFAAFSKAIDSAPPGRLGPGGISSWLLGTPDGEGFGKPEEDLKGFHDEIEKEMLFPHADGFLGRKRLTEPSAFKPRAKSAKAAEKPTAVGEKR